MDAPTKMHNTTISLIMASSDGFAIMAALERLFVGGEGWKLSMLCSVPVMFSQELCARQIKCVIQRAVNMYGSTKATTVRGKSLSVLNSVVPVPHAAGVQCSRYLKIYFLSLNVRSQIC